jgi:site-specific DNA recombinase
MKSSAPSFGFEQLRGLRARGYVRVSTTDQADGYSPAMQRAREQAFAQQHGLAWDGTVYEEHLSGRSAVKRSQFQQAVADAEARQFDVLLVFHSSRFARNAVDARLYKERLARAGIAIVFVAQYQISGAPHGWMAERIDEIMDEGYSRTLSLLTAGGWRQKFDEGDMLGTPFAYRRTRAGKIVPDLRPRPCVQATDNTGLAAQSCGSAGRSEERECHVTAEEYAPQQPGGRNVGSTYTPWEVVREVGWRYLSGGASDADIAAWCNAQGWRNRQGQPFTRESIRYLLTQPENAGYATYHRKQGSTERHLIRGIKSPWTPEEYEAISRLRAARASTEGRKHTATRWYPFSGAEHSCGERMIGVGHRARRVLVCRNHLQQRGRGEWCPGQPVDVAALEALTGRLLAMVRLSNEDIDHVLARFKAAIAAPAAGQREAITARRKRLAELYELGDVSRADYLARRSALDAELAVLPPVVDHLATFRAEAERLRDTALLWVTAQPDTRARIVKELFARAVIDGRTLKVWPKAEYLALFSAALREGRELIVSDPPGVHQEVTDQDIRQLISHDTPSSAVFDSCGPEGIREPTNRTLTLRDSNGYTLALTMPREVSELSA